MNHLWVLENQFGNHWSIVIQNTEVTTVNKGTVPSGDWLGSLLAHLCVKNSILKGSSRISNCVEKWKLQGTVKQQRRTC